MDFMHLSSFLLYSLQPELNFVPVFRFRSELNAPTVNTQLVSRWFTACRAQTQRFCYLDNTYNLGEASIWCASKSNHRMLEELALSKRGETDLHCCTLTHQSNGEKWHSIIAPLISSSDLLQGNYQRNATSQD